ncbi:ABC transporter substrate-binding protein [Rubritalea spongiae]|uniref:ABC transporter substrate-binding protein n=1 Tax=Rubritalea spongiae TaxID=430797 RepID=A0ABW5E4A8_9BACT
MKFTKIVVVLAVTLVAFWGSAVFKRVAKDVQEESVERVEDEQIIAMAPSSGEVLFELGLGDQLVGVSRYMRYPKAAEGIPKIGGYLDVDLESLLGLEPTVVVLLKEQADLAKQLDGLGVQHMAVDHMSIGGIQESVKILGERFQKEAKAQIVTESIQQAISEAENAGDGKGKLKVLISLGRSAGDGLIGTLTAAGAKGYHQELLKVIGVENAYQGGEAFPQLNREHLLRMDPDIIIDLFNSSDFRSLGEERILNDWQQLEELTAVKEGQVHVLGDDVHFIPGPRFVVTLQVIAEIVEAYAID